MTVLTVLTLFVIIFLIMYSYAKGYKAGSKKAFEIMADDNDKFLREVMEESQKFKESLLAETRAVFRR
jgi:ribosomal protein L9